MSEDGFDGDNEYLGKGGLFALSPEDIDGLSDAQIIQLEKVHNVLNDVAGYVHDIEDGLVGGIVGDYDPEKRCALQGVFEEEFGKFRMLMLALAALHVEDGEWGEALLRNLSHDLRDMDVNIPNEFTSAEANAIRQLYDQSVDIGSTMLAASTLPADSGAIGTRYSAALKDDFCERLEKLAQDPEHNVVPLPV
ncbi:MAG: hypothetical protein ACRBCK_07790 [Alphaproteobacteria bacterium]